MTTILRRRLACAMLAACAPEGITAMEEQQQQHQQPIGLELIVEPRVLAMADRKSFRIGIAATNRGIDTVDPQLHRARLLVNGRESPAWNLAIGNGRREARWFALPPGETVSFTWTSLGESLFPGPGDHLLVLRLDGLSSPPVQVRVEADAAPRSR